MQPFAFGVDCIDRGVDTNGLVEGRLVWLEATSLWNTGADNSG